ncbi:hypothetical protein SHKM778_46990 [Streptomyces sp. KM77-8]|uniref:Uncharacterized protein n=1 Tax=Streptomyces haneummycinicus TaxID=3074435 RepID=A0AAT9HLC4_9ACTN
MAGPGVFGHEFGDGRAESGGLLRLDGRTANRQLTVRESRHKSARDVCHGRRGIHQAYRGRPPGPGQVVRAASNSAWARAQTSPGWKVSELQVAEVSSPLPW